MIDVSRHQTNPPVASDFVLRTWRFSGHIARDGQRGGAFANSKNSRHMRHAAIMLLVTVIMDLTVNMGYFIRLFLGIEGADLTADDEQILLDLGYASTGTAQPLRHLRVSSRSSCSEGQACMTRSNPLDDGDGQHRVHSSLHRCTYLCC